MSRAGDFLEQFNEADFDADDMALLGNRMDHQKIKTDFVNGHRICYTGETVFQVEIIGNEYSDWTVKYKIAGDVGRAVMMYKGINIGNGYGKRLVMPNQGNGTSFEGRTLAEVHS